MLPAAEVERAARVQLACGAARAVVSPARGALCVAWSVEGRELLYLDVETLETPGRNVRGGVPVLFPSPGALRGGRFSVGGRTGAMGQHGFARNLPFSVTARGDDAVGLRLESSPETLAQFPFAFALGLDFRLSASALQIDARIENPGAEPLPFAFGFHPYFLVAQADKAGTRIDTAATRAFDNVGKREVALEGPIDLSAGEVDLHLIDHGRSDAALVLADGSRLVLRGSPEYRRFVVWTLPGRDFVCLEPWTAPADALNSGEGLLVVAPGQQRTLALALAWTGPPPR